jgi:hypothetical protein
MGFYFSVKPTVFPEVLLTTFKTIQGLLTFRFRLALEYQRGLFLFRRNILGLTRSVAFAEILIERMVSKMFVLYYLWDEQNKELLPFYQN